MILQRLSKTLSERDWGTVFIEVLILVVGIFLALQVDDWNEQRKERIRESRYLDRLYADLERDIREIESSLEA